MIARMRRLATLLALLPVLFSHEPAAQPAGEEIGTWRLTCTQDRMTDRTACLLRHRDWVEPPGGSAPGLVLEVVDRGGRLLPAVTARDLSLESASRGLLALTGTVQLRFPPNRFVEMPCGLEGRSLVCAPRESDAARMEQELPQAERVLLRMTGLGSGGSTAEPRELPLAGTREALARFRQRVPPSPPDSAPALDGRELLQRLQRLFGN